MTHTLWSIEDGGNVELYGHTFGAGDEALSDALQCVLFRALEGLCSCFMRIKLIKVQHSHIDYSRPPNGCLGNGDLEHIQTRMNPHPHRPKGTRLTDFELADVYLNLQIISLTGSTGSVPASR